MKEGKPGAAPFSGMLFGALLLSACMSPNGAPDETSDTAASGGADAALVAAPKINICHIPPGSPANAYTLNLSLVFVRLHLAHGDYLGACTGRN